jgi:hypothetical protein
MRARTVVRLAWFMSAVVVAVLGFDLLLRAWLGDTGWFLIGVGAGIACAVLGSLAHDALVAGTGDRRLP